MAGKITCPRGEVVSAVAERYRAAGRLMRSHVQGRANRRDPGTRPELRLPTAQLNANSLCVRIRPDRRASVRPFKGIVCDDISEFESPAPAVGGGSSPSTVRWFGDIVGAYLSGAATSLDGMDRSALLAPGMLRPAYLKSKLNPPIFAKRRRALRTIREACARVPPSACGAWPHE
jgi:hypothetical protein